MIALFFRNEVDQIFLSLLKKEPNSNRRFSYFTMIDIVLFPLKVLLILIDLSVRMNLVRTLVISSVVLYAMLFF